jgi:hypothetical protein
MSFPRNVLFMELDFENSGSSCGSHFGSSNLISAYESKYCVLADTGQYHNVCYDDYHNLMLSESNNHFLIW